MAGGLLHQLRSEEMALRVQFFPCVYDGRRRVDTRFGRWQGGVVRPGRVFC